MCLPHKDSTEHYVNQSSFCGTYCHPVSILVFFFDNPDFEGGTMSHPNLIPMVPIFNS